MLRRKIMFIIRCVNRCPFTTKGKNRGIPSVAGIVVRRFLRLSRLRCWRPYPGLLIPCISRAGKSIHRRGESPTTAGSHRSSSPRSAISSFVGLGHDVAAIRSLTTCRVASTSPWHHAHGIHLSPCSPLWASLPRTARASPRARRSSVQSCTNPPDVDIKMYPDTLRREPRSGSLTVRLSRGMLESTNVNVRCSRAGHPSSLRNWNRLATCPKAQTGQAGEIPVP